MKRNKIYLVVAAFCLGSTALGQQITIGVLPDNQPLAETTTANSTIAIGDKNTFAGTQSTPSSSVGSSGAIAIGFDNLGAVLTTGLNGGIAIGIGAQAIGMQSSVAVGPYANASGDYGVAVGSNATAGGYTSLAIGAGSIANDSESIALGSNSVTTRDREVSVGANGFTRSVANVSDGVISTDATNLGQVRSISNSVLQSSINYTDTSLIAFEAEQKAYTNAAVANGLHQANSYTDSKFNESKGFAYSGASMAMASSALVFDPNKARQVAVAAATVHGKSSIAAGMAWQTGRSSLVNIRISSSSNSMTGIAGGFSKSW